MRFREHVFDFLARFNVPVRHVVLFHLFDPLVRQPFPLTHAFRNFERERRIHTALYRSDTA